MVYRRKSALSHIRRSRTYPLRGKISTRGSSRDQNRHSNDGVGLSSNIKYPSVDGLIALNKQLLAEIKTKKADTFQLLSRQRLQAVMKKVENEGVDIYDKAAILLMELVQQHPFASGNRRTALTATLTFLQINGQDIEAEYDPQVLQGIRERFYTTDEIKAWLRGHEIRKFKRT